MWGITAEAARPPSPRLIKHRVVDYVCFRPFPNGLTTSRAHSMNSVVAGFIVRFFKVTIPTGYVRMDTSVDQLLSERFSRQ
jgi:hypothetical protein